MTFESVHDMAYPIDALRKMKDMVSENGAILVGDVKMKDKLEDTHYSIKRKGQYYVFSDQSLPDLIVVSVHKSGVRATTISVIG